MVSLSKRKLLLKPEYAAPKTQKEIQEKYHVNLVLNNPRFRQIVSSLLEGTTATEVARYFALQGWLSVNERTFVEALRTFRRAHPELIANPDDQSINSLVPMAQPRIDEEAALEQLLRVQQRRLNIDVRSEISIGKLFNTTPREIEATRRVAETLAKLRGKIKDGSSGGAEPTSQDVLEDLSKIRKDEVTRNRLHALVGEITKKGK